MSVQEVQTELIKFLAKHLKKRSLELAAFRSVFATFTDEGRSRALECLEGFRASPALEKIVEDQYRDLDTLIERIALGLQEEEFRKLLEQCDPDGPIN